MKNALHTVITALEMDIKTVKTVHEQKQLYIGL